MGEMVDQPVHHGRVVLSSSCFSLRVKRCLKSWQHIGMRGRVLESVRHSESEQVNLRIEGQCIRPKVRLSVFPPLGQGHNSQLKGLCNLAVPPHFFRI